VSGALWTKEESESFWTGLAAFLRKEMRDCDRVQLYRLRPEFAGGSTPEKESAVCPYLDLAGKKSLDEVLADCHGSHRGDVKRQIRRLSAQGDLSVRRFGARELVQAEVALQEFFRAYDEQWSPKGPHVFETTLGRSFMEGVLKDLLPTGLLHFSVLYCGVTPVHWHFGFVFRDRFYFYKLALDRYWSNYSPGKIHTALLIGQCIADGIRYFDFLYGNEPYKYWWTSQSYPLYQREWWNGLRPVNRFVHGIPPAQRRIKDLLRPGYRAVKNIFKQNKPLLPEQP
jgi:CelD/BcsL family acetyltransferase involved in cellulose biosynthesis